MVEKNVKKELAKKQRVWYNRNTGTISHKSDKYPTRQKLKLEVKRMS